MAGVIIIVSAVLFFYFMLKLGGMLESTTKKEEPKKSAPRYSPHTIREKPKTNETEIIVRLLNTQDDEEDGLYEFKINGLQHYCTKYDECVFEGVVFNESSNPYNKRAMAVVNMSPKILGYVPEFELKEYREWSKGQSYPCVGFIRCFVDEIGEEKIFGRATAIKPCNIEFVNRMKKELIDGYKEELKRLQEKYG